MTNAETELRRLWMKEGGSIERQNECIAQTKAKAQPGAKVGPFTIPYRTEMTSAGEQSVIPGCERDRAPGVKQLELF